MRQLTKNMQPIIISLLFMGVSIGLVWWLWNGVEAQGSKLQERMQTIADKQVFENQFAELNRIVEETAADREILEQFIVKDDADTIALLSKFDEIAAGQNVELSTRNLAVVETSTKFNDLSLSYNFTGSEASVRRMIRMFETLPYHGRITDLSLQRSVGESGVRTATGEVSLLLSIQKYDQ